MQIENWRLLHRYVLLGRAGGDDNDLQFSFFNFQFAIQYISGSLGGRVFQRR